MRCAEITTALALISAALVVQAPGVASAQAGAPIGAPVVFDPKPGTTLTIDGRGPFHGSIEIHREGSGVTIVNDLDLDSYVGGIREVPGLWPMEALKAQAVASRTYALWEKQRGYWRRFGFDVCATVSCQVYQGAAAEAGLRGRRWVEAVHSTAGEVLLYDGQPALTRYHASSGGRTLPNEVVYPSSGALPYLRAIDDPQDHVSPLYRWEVPFTRAGLERILHDAIGLGGTLADVRADEQARRVEVKTQHGSLEMTTVRFRRVVSETAPKVFPDRYPSPRADGKALPVTIPSSRFNIRRTDDGFLVQGKGYGHGVGMSQWGTKGRAEEGQPYADILAAYYGGLRPKRLGGSTTMRVAVVRGAPSVRISGDGPFSVSTAGQTLASSTLGGWSVVASGTRSLRVQPPQGFSLPLVLTGVRAPEQLLVDPPEQGGTLDVDFVVPKPAQVTGVLTREGAVLAGGRIVVEAGEHRLRIPLAPDDLPRRATYELNIRAYDGTKTVEETRDVVLTRPASDLPLRAGIGTAVALALYIFWRRRRRQSSTMPLRGQRSPEPHG